MCSGKLDTVKSSLRKFLLLLTAALLEGEWENDGLGRAKKLEIGVRRKSLRNLAGDRIVRLNNLFCLCWE